MIALGAGPTKQRYWVMPQVTFKGVAVLTHREARRGDWTVTVYATPHQEYVRGANSNTTSLQLSGQTGQPPLRHSEQGGGFPGDSAHTAPVPARSQQTFAKASGQSCLSGFLGAGSKENRKIRSLSLRGCETERDRENTDGHHDYIVGEDILVSIGKQTRIPKTLEKPGQ